MKVRRPARLVVLCGLALALFSTVFSLAAWYDWWPRLPPGALHDTDLWAGLLAAGALLFLLLRRSPGKASSPSSGTEPPVR